MVIYNTFPYLLACPFFMLVVALGTQVRPNTLKNQIFMMRPIYKCSRHMVKVFSLRALFAKSSVVIGQDVSQQPIIFLCRGDAGRSVFSHRIIIFFFTCLFSFQI